MFHFKSCPRCEGDMRDSGDMYGDYRQCLMCGHMIDFSRAKLNFSFARGISGQRRKLRAA